ncbi:c-type cytochrome [Amantichitinum ursilacus]|uniref:Cytochrome c-551 n=1 Tax=Amantichitinum ursilacus TaxID=857265 RepID=A0A0N0GMZ7_9NEIS|nr:c-type cytochrome [Amantichitinum ursilacus]KPC52132.1 Cytochrome c-551 precursor [Amantichitinum ursilacus]
MRACTLLIATVLLSAGASAQAAEDGAKIAAKYNCLACHAVDHKIVGPAYRDVANKYRGQPGIEAKLMKKVKEGGGGTWGTISMPAQVIGDDDLRTIVKWVLAQK